MAEPKRAELTGADRAVSETLDEVNVRMHGLRSVGYRLLTDTTEERS